MPRVPHPTLHRPDQATRPAGGLIGIVLLALLGGLLLAAPPAASSTASAADPTDGLVLRYDLTQASGTTVTDSSGNGNDGTLTGGGTWTGNALQLDGVDDHVDLPDHLMAGLDAITVSVDVKIDATQATPYFIWGLGNTDSSTGFGNGYLFTTGNGYRTSIATGNWSTEQTVNSGRNLARDVWGTLTYTLDAAGTATLYLDGNQVGQKTGTTIKPADIGNGQTTANYLGRSLYSADKYLKGMVRGFRIYDRALSAAEVTDLADASFPSRDRVAGDIAALDLGDLSAVTEDLSLPTGGANGSTITWESSAPETIATDGRVTRPAPGSDPVEVTLTATVSHGTASDTKSFAATVIPDEDDASKAAAAAAAIELVNPDDVRGHLTLPTSGRHEATIAWATDAPEVVSADGIVNRPANGSGDVTVTLTATVTVGTASTTRDFVLTVRELPAAQSYEGYAFSYFTFSDESIYFAASQGNNALKWTELNGGRPTHVSSKGTGGLRDPFLIRSPEGDRFFMIATDLDIEGTNWDASQRTGSKHLEIWESTDLVNWSEQRHVKVAPDNAGNLWAPEAYWDDELDAYVVFWASKLYAENDPNHTGSTYNKMLYATTRDFVTFSEAKVWQDRNESRIDSTVIKEGETYYRFTKDEGGGGTGCSDIIQEKASSLTAVDLPGNPSWEFMTACIGRDAGTSAVEGPTVFKANPGDTSANDYYLFVDEYGGRGYVPLGTDDLENPDWQAAESYSLPGRPRHGTVIPVTQAELDRLHDELVDVPDPVQADENGLVAHYELDETSGTTAADSSGHGYDGALSGDATWTDGALTLGGTNGHVKLPDNMMAGLDAITVSTEVWVDQDQSTPYFIWGLGNTAPDGAGNGYLFATGDGAYRTSIASGNWTTEQTATSGNSLQRGAWQALTYTLQDGTATLYLDGVKVGETTDVTIVPGDIGGGWTTANYIGRSVYTNDKYLEGKVRDYRIYNRALSAAEVRDIAADPTAITGVELDSLKVPAVIDSASSTVTLPVEPGTDLTALDPAYVVVPSSSVSVSGPQDYSQAVTVTVTAGDGTSRDWTVKAVAMKSPVLPGLYADPNIVEFDGTYYIYATTDGFAGWGGKEFYVWKSTNLVDWERSEQPFLTLDGANGNVPWATGNAWAPTIIERDGKYYFYFSGHNPTHNRKTIGVAVADSPEGPFTAEPTAMIVNNEAVTSGQAIDPAAFRDPATGKYYLFWGNGGPTTGPVMAELGDDMASLKEGTISRVSGLTGFREGLFVNHRDGLYHLTYSIDDTGSPNYRVGYATATSIDGPWTYHGVILEKDAAQGILGTGHSSILQVPGTDDWYIAYHRFAIPGGNGTHRETTIDRLEFGEDGLIQKVVPTLESIDPAPVATGLPTIGGRPVVGARLVATTGEWDQEGLAFDYQWLRGDAPIVGATDRTYVPMRADVGHRLSVQVTARRDGVAPGVARSTATRPVVKARGVVRARLSDRTPKVRAETRLSIRLAARPARVAARGTVVVRVDGKVRRRLVVTDGSARVNLRFGRPGRHVVAVKYLGSPTVTSDKVVRTVRVHR